VVIEFAQLARVAPILCTVAAVPVGFVMMAKITNAITRNQTSLFTFTTTYRFAFPGQRAQYPVFLPHGASTRTSGTRADIISLR